MNFKKTFGFAVITLALFALPVGQASAQVERVTICHNGNTMEVAAPAVPAHLNHGDTLGPCVAPVVPEFGLITGALALVTSAGSFIILKRKKTVS